METLTRLVTDSLARHGFDRPMDPRRLQWSPWFRCESPHSLLIVPSKPGIFAIAEDIMDLGFNTTHVETAAPSTAHEGTAPQACPERSRRGCPAEQSSAPAFSATTLEERKTREGHDFSRAVTPRQKFPASAELPLGGAALQRCDSTPIKEAASAAEGSSKRLLAVLQFSEDDDMAFTLDRMFTRINPMRARLASGKCFLRFVVIEDQTQRRSICSALNQWMLSSAEKASGIPAGFSSSLELAPVTDRVGRTLLSDSAGGIPKSARVVPPVQPPDSKQFSPSLDSGANKNIHCPHPLPSGF
jgi:hypothetical protein